MLYTFFPYLVPFLVLGFSPFVSLSYSTVPCILISFPILTCTPETIYLGFPPYPLSTTLLCLSDINKSSLPLSCAICVILVLEDQILPVPARNYFISAGFL